MASLPTLVGVWGPIGRSLWLYKHDRQRVRAIAGPEGTLRHCSTHCITLPPLFRHPDLHVLLLEGLAPV